MNQKSLFGKARKYIPAGVHSPVRAFLSVKGSPIFINRAKGAYLYDENNRKFLDFCMGWGSLALGHAQNKVISSIKKQASLGTYYGTVTKLDIELSKGILSRIQPFEKIRFVNSGTEAVMTAIRLARGVTNKNMIVKIDGSYHGHTDSMLVSSGSGLITKGTGSSDGVPQSVLKDTLVVKYNSREALKKVFSKYGDKIAALIIEPVLANCGLFEHDLDYHKLCRALTTKHKSLLIYDEVITGFRLSYGGAKEVLNITPDIATYGKVIGGGLPVGAVAGFNKFMKHLAPEGNVYQAGTLSANPLTMSAGLATLNVMNKTFYSQMEKLGLYMDSVFKKIKNIHYKRVASIFWLYFEQQKASKAKEILSSRYKLYHKEFVDRGIYLPPSAFEVCFLSSAHKKKDIDKLAQAVLDLV